MTRQFQQEKVKLNFLTLFIFIAIGISNVHSQNNLDYLPAYGSDIDSNDSYIENSTIDNTMSWRIDDNDNQGYWGFFRWWIQSEYNDDDRMIMQISKRGQFLVKSGVHPSSRSGKFPHIMLDPIEGRHENITLSLNSTTDGHWKRIGGNGPLAFWTDGNQYANDNPSLYIQNNGNMGIGTTTPNKKLHVKGALKLSDADGDKIFFTAQDTGSRITHSPGWKVNYYAGKPSTSAQHRFYAGDNLGLVVDETKTVSAGESFGILGTNTIKLGYGAGSGIPLNASKSHVFIGHNAGNKESFDEVALIDYSDPANTNPITGVEYLDNHSVFVLNNHNDLNKPLLFGNFAKHNDDRSMSQLAINTHHIIDSVALTVAGAVHIGPKDLDPKVFPSKKGYEDALLWVEKGIVTENVTYAFTSNWKDWPDYVFEKNYELMDLNTLDRYIRKEKHLPGIVSREEVKENGLKSREMMTNLLLKIEELTLYTIAQEKKIEAQKQQNKTLLNRLNAIEEQLNK